MFPIIRIHKCQLKNSYCIHRSQSEKSNRRMLVIINDCH